MTNPDYETVSMLREIIREKDTLLLGMLDRMDSAEALLLKMHIIFNEDRAPGIFDFDRVKTETTKHLAKHGLI